VYHLVTVSSERGINGVGTAEPSTIRLVSRVRHHTLGAPSRSNMIHGQLSSWYECETHKDQVDGSGQMRDLKSRSGSTTAENVCNSALPLKPFFERADMSPITLYEGTRHSIASQAVNRGVNLYALASFPDTRT
jgi:hypothetical protein